MSSLATRITANFRRAAEEAVRGSALSRCAYSAALRIRARRRAARGRNFEALDELCNAYRRVGVAGLADTLAEAMVAVARAASRRDGDWLPSAENRLLQEFNTLPRAEAIRGRFRAEPLDDRVRLRLSRPSSDPGRQGNLIVLKAPDQRTGERGVLLLKYNPTFEEFPAVFDAPEVLCRYQLALEPSSYCNCEPSLFLFLGADADVVMQCTDAADLAMLDRLGSNIAPIALGAADWVDPECFAPSADAEREFDVVMVASWSRLKRHTVLFDALARLRPLRPRVALVGYPADLTRDALERSMRRRGVAEQCRVFESVPPAEVARVVARSKMAVHLSRREGTNKAAHEALFCDTPLIVYRHNRGFRPAALNPETGILADDAELADAIAWMLDHHREFHPRRWALANTGWPRATAALGDALRRQAEARGAPWTRDIVGKLNRPNLRYARDDDRAALDPCYRDLARFLIDGGAA